MEQEKLVLTLKDEAGNEKEFEGIAQFDLEETGKSYLIYTDNTVDEEGNTKIYASSYIPTEDGGIGSTLNPIETEREWKYVEKIIEGMQEQAEEKGVNE